MSTATVIRCLGDFVNLRIGSKKPRAVSVLLDDSGAASVFADGDLVSFRLLGFDGRSVGGYFRRGVELRLGGRRFRGLKVS